jgi:hypothetical protein
MNISKHYELESRITDLVLCPESYCPKRSLKIQIDIPFPNMGGRRWSKEFIDEQEATLLEEVVAELREKVMEYFDVDDPYGDHRGGSRPKKISK